MGKSDNKSRVLGDDPLAWLNADADKKPSKKKLTPKKKRVPKVKADKVKADKVKADKVKADKVKADAEVKGEKNRLVLESSLVINKANDIYESLKKLEGKGQEIEIDVSKVESIDTAILQLLCVFVLRIKEDNIKLSWHKPTEVLLNKASTLGLSKLLNF